MDEVFRAIDDPNRRLLLDALFDDDGQTLSEMCAHLPTMTRQGVMNHLRVLEDAKLVSTRRDGRTKHHYLNPVPIRMIHDRWISRFAEARVSLLAALPSTLEEGNPMTAPVHVYTTFIRSTIEEVWDALTNPDVTAKYFFGTRVECDWEAGSPMNYYYPDGRLASTGEILAIGPPNSFECLFQPEWDEDLKAQGPVREIWRLSENNGMVEATLEMYDIEVDSAIFRDLTSGSPWIIASMKSLLETGEPLPPPTFD